MSEIRSKTMPKQDNAALSLVVGLFFVCGFSSVLNTILIPYLQQSLALSYLEANLISLSFYLAYFVTAPIAGEYFKSRSYIHGLQVGLALGALGALMLALLNVTPSLIGVIVSIFALGSGVTVIQVCGNPYITGMGSAETSSSRLAMAHAATSVGMMFAPYAGSYLLLSTLSMETSQVIFPPLQLSYLMLGFIWLLLLAGAVWLALPCEKDVEIIQESNSPFKILSDKVVIWGVLGIAASAGIEVASASFLIKYLSSQHVLGNTLEAAGMVSGLFWLLFTFGRIAGSFLLKRVDATVLLFVHALCGMCCGVLAAITQGYMAAICVLLLGLTTSVIFPIIFSLTLQESSSNKSSVSGVLCMANIGGALFPLTQGFVADAFGIQLSYLIPAAGYIIILCYALKIRRHRITG